MQTKARMQSEARCEPFISIRIDPFTIDSFLGTTYLGFPFNINYQSISDVPEASLRFAGDDLRLASDHPQRALLVASLVLPEETKRFLFARQIAYAESHHWLVTSSVTAGSAFLAYFGCSLLNRHGLRHSRLPLLYRFVPFFAICAFAWLMRYSVLRQYALQLDAKTDRRAAALGPEYARGGLAFYEGLVRRNVLYRALFKSDSEADSYFTKQGNECVSSLTVYGLLTQQRLAGLRRLHAKSVAPE